MFEIKMRPLIQHQERELVILLRQGDRNAFDKLYYRYVPRLTAFSRTYIKNEEEAEEAVQEIFIKIWEKRKSLDQTNTTTTPTPPLTPPNSTPHPLSTHPPPPPHPPPPLPPRHSHTAHPPPPPPPH